MLEGNRRVIDFLFFLFYLFCFIGILGCGETKVSPSSSIMSFNSSEKRIQEKAPEIYAFYLGLKSEDRSVRQKSRDAFLRAESKIQIALPALVDLLQKEPRKEILEVLAQMEGGEDLLKQFLPLFLELLSKAEWKLSVIPILGRLGASAKEATPILREALSENNLYVVIAAIRALSRIEKQPESFFVFLIGLLQKEEHFGVFDAIGEAFYLQKESVQLQRIFSQQNKTTQLRIIRAYGQIPEEAILQELLKLLSDSDSQIRQMTAKILEKFAFASEKIIPLLESFFLQETAIEGKIAAASTLILLGSPSEEVFYFVQNAFAYPNPEIRVEVVSLFKTVSKAVFQKRIPELLRALQDEEQEVRKAAMEVFRVQKHFPPNSLPLLLTLLQAPEEDLFVKLGAISVLGEIRSKEALPLLIDSFLNEKNMLLQMEAKKALVSLGNIAVPSLWGVFNKQELDILFRGQALQALGEIGSTAKELLPQLESTLEKENHLMLRGLLKKTIQQLKATD